MHRAVLLAGGLGVALGFVAAPVAAQPQPLVVATEPPAHDPVAYEKPPPGLGDCTFFSEPICPLSLVAELGMAGGQSQSNVGLKDYGHFFADVGFLARTPGVRDLHIGPVFELAVEVNDIAVGWMASPRMRARYFAGGTEFILEGSFGPGFQRFAYTNALETGTRVGAVTDFSFGWRGIVGPFAQLDALHDLGGNDGTDLRWMAGLRANLLGWAYAFGGAFSGGKIIH